MVHIHTDIYSATQIKSVASFWGQATRKIPLLFCGVGCCRVARKLRMSFVIRNVLSRALSFFSHPLVSIAVTLFAAALLYLPHYLLPIIFSPIPILTLTLLMAVLRFGAAQRRVGVGREEGPSSRFVESVRVEPGTGTVFEPNPPFVGWNVRAPLEVIYEEREGEEENDEKTSPPMLLPESDTDSSSEGELLGTGRWDWPEKFEWDREELIEMTLGGVERAPRIEKENLLIDIDS